MASAVSSDKRSLGNVGNSIVELREQNGLVVNYPLVLIAGRVTAKETEAGEMVQNDQVENYAKDFPLQRHENNNLSTTRGEAVCFDEQCKEKGDQTPENNTEEQMRVERLQTLNEVAIKECNIQNRMATSRSKLFCKSSPLEHSQSWPILDNGITKMFVPLKKGENIVSFSNTETNESQHTLSIRYEPIHNKRYVRLVYLVCANSDGNFDAPEGEDNTVESAKKRISFNARVLQTFTAENLNAHGFGRRTFRIEEDDEGDAIINIFKSKLELEKALCMTGDELYQYFHEEIGKSHLYDPLCKLWVYMSCTRYLPPTKEDGFDDSYKNVPQYVKGHTALGGGNMALFGTGSLHNWAQNLDELVTRFTDVRKIDRACLFDDSARRGYYWANYSTSLGAAMHELGHTFNLPHTPSGIMGRGFDDMHKFILPHGESNNEENSQLATTVKQPYIDGGAHWHRSSAAILSCSRWIGDHPDDDSPLEIPVPMMVKNANQRGPVGGIHDKLGVKTVDFSIGEWLKSESLTLKGIRFKATKYVNAIQIVGVKNECQMDDTNETPPTSSQWFGDAENGGKTHEFYLSLKDEKSISLDVRAGSWIDAVRLHTSHQSSAWIGGKGGDLYALKFDDDGIDDIFGTAGEDHILSIGITQQSANEQQKEQEKQCHFYSEFGIRVIELRKENGEVMKHWEYLEEDAKQRVTLSHEELFMENGHTVAAYDGCGTCGVHRVDHFKNS